MDIFTASEGLYYNSLSNVGNKKIIGGKVMTGTKTVSSTVGSNTNSTTNSTTSSTASSNMSSSIDSKKLKNMPTSEIFNLTTSDLQKISDSSSSNDSNYSDSNTSPDNEEPLSNKMGGGGVDNFEYQLNAVMDRTNKLMQNLNKKIGGDRQSDHKYSTENISKSLKLKNDTNSTDFLKNDDDDSSSASFSSSESVITFGKHKSKKTNGLLSETSDNNYSDFSELSRTKSLSKKNTEKNSEKKPKVTIVKQGQYVVKTPTNKSSGRRALSTSDGYVLSENF